MKKLNFPKIEKKWQSKWASQKAFQVSLSSNKKKYYVLEMYPYPSASGLHMGHAFNYTIGDIQARYKRMSGFQVLYPMGYDSFGLPAENAAIKAKSHPKKFTEQAIKNFIKQQKSLGLSYDWSRMIYSHDPNYYKWNQYFFLHFLKNNLVYRKKSLVNWCPDCSTVLANEQVHNGKCWRHTQTSVDLKPLEQWFIKTTKYAEELLEQTHSLDWPARIKTMQQNWIGKSHGTEINFEIKGKPWKIFTTRPDTIYGVTFMVISAQHPHLNDLVTSKQEKEIASFLRKIKNTSQEDIEKLDKEGVFTGSYATNPITKEEIPIYAGNFVLADYGSGMVMAVPAHDQRDFEFAKKYNLPIKQVIKPNNKDYDPNQAFTDHGTLINSGKFSSLSSEKAKKQISEYLEKNNLGKTTIQYKLRDWLVSRQRYWGTPIPIIYCDTCGIVPVPESDLPITLPEKVRFGKGNPLTTSSDFINTTCPKCKSPAKRETDTMDTFFDSSWYFMRFTNPQNKKLPFTKKTAESWLPVDQYIGGSEHACMHLIYARFFTKALRDLKLLNINEPFTRLFNQGMLHGSDSYVMSKSRGNVILPETISKKYGIDTARLFLISVASPNKDIKWSDTGIESTSKLIHKIYDYITNSKTRKSSEKNQHKINKAIQDVSKDIESFNYNLAVIKIRKLFESLDKEISKKDLESLIKLISPVTPHIAEELWHFLGNKNLVSLESWPLSDSTKINPQIEAQEQAFEKTLSDINNIIKLIKSQGSSSPTKIYIYTIPPEKDNYDEKLLSAKLSLKVNVFASNSPSLYDPENKAKKAKPGKPGIYIE